MKKNMMSTMILAALAFAAISPAGAFGYLANPQLRENALEVLKRAKAAMPDPDYWKDKTVRKAKRMWYCFTNKSQCSQSEVNQARAWIIGVPTAIAVALLAVGGAMVTKNRMDAAKAETYGREVSAKIMAMTPEERFVQNMATFMQETGMKNYNDINNSAFLRRYPAFQEENKSFYDSNADIRKDLYEKAIELLNQSGM